MKISPTEIVSITMSDGVKLAAAIYRPIDSGRYPALFAASPYRFDNNNAPDVPIFLWHETGPIAWYVERGYAYVHLDVRGSGRSDGEFRFLDRREQRDFYEVIEWIAQQPWSNGKVGGIGQSYYAMAQWFMAIDNPPHLAGIAPFDGLVDNYRAMAYSGGIASSFISFLYNKNVRPINQYPVEGPSRMMPWDFPMAVREHPTYDDFWKERAASENLENIKVPVFSIGVWSKVDLHLDGNLIGFQRARGDKKLLVFGSPNLFAAVADFSTPAFHEKYMLPFYDWCLKGKRTSYVDEPAVRYYVNGADTFKTADTWPIKGISYKSFYLTKGPTGSVTSLNDGGLGAQPPGDGETIFDYPNEGWRMGVVGFGPDARPDPVRRVLSFTSEPLESDMEIVGPIKLVLYASCSRTDTDFIVKVSEQLPQPEEERKKGLNPGARVLTKGWLRASFRALDPKRSSEYEPWYTYASPTPLTPGEIYKFEIRVVATAHRFKKGNRIRLELANGDSQLTELIFEHEYTPDKMGRDTIYHGSKHPSHILLPVVPI